MLHLVLPRRLHLSGLAISRAFQGSFRRRAVTTLWVTLGWVRRQYPSLSFRPSALGQGSRGNLGVPGRRHRTRKPLGAWGLPPAQPASSSTCRRQGRGSAEEPGLTPAGRPITSRGFPSAGARRRRVGSRAGSGSASPGSASPRAPGSGACAAVLRAR